MFNRRNLSVVMLVAFLLALVVIATVSAGGRPFSTDLSGANEVPPASTGDPDGSGQADLTLNQGQGEVCFDITVSNIGTITAAHIHVGAAGTNGPVVVNFAPTVNGLSNCVSGVDRDLIKAIRQNHD